MNIELKNQRLRFNFWIYSFASCVMKMYLNSTVDLPVKYDNTCLTVLFLIFNEQMYVKYLALSTGYSISTQRIVYSFLGKPEKLILTHGGDTSLLHGCLKDQVGVRLNMVDVEASTRAVML